MVLTFPYQAQLVQFMGFCAILALLLNHNPKTAKAPWSWGRTYDFCTFFRKDERSNPAANSKQFFERIGNETRTPARERPFDARTGALEIGLDLKLVRLKNKRLDSKDVELRERNKKDVVGGRVRYEAFKKRELQQETRAVEAHLH